MIEFEQYKNNLLTYDQHGLGSVEVTKRVIYTGNVAGVIKKKEIEEEVNRNQSLDAAVIGINNTGPLPKNLKLYTAWTDIDAQELLLSSKPTCYLILSKPGAGVYSLGEAMSKKFKCIHLCPHNIITDEIAQMSSTGKCMEFNMRNNKAIKFDIIIKILRIKLESLAVQHRGYVISGFPLVTSSKNSKYLVNTLYGEEGIEIVDELLIDTIADMKKKKKRYDAAESPHTSATSHIGELGEGEGDIEEEEEHDEELPEEEEEQKVELPKFLLDSCSDVIHPVKAYYDSKKVVLLQQVNDLFGLELKPDIVIYVSCPDKDLVIKKTHKYINYKTNNQIVEPLTKKHTPEVRWPVKYVTSDIASTHENYSLNLKYWCRQPINFQHNSVEQMCNYKYNILPFVEKKLQDMDPNCVIKIDACVTLHEMMHNVSERLMNMAMVPVLIPEPLYIEDPPDDMDEFWTSIQSQIVVNGNVPFYRSASLWSDRCPVELKKRRAVKGKPKLAVSFSKHVYLTATLENMISFCRNPRPYLKKKYLEPTCRVIVIGTKSSGKTMISECLSWLFDTPIIHYNTCIQTEKQKKYDIYAKTILSEIIATIEDARFAKWQNANIDRLSNLEIWCEPILTKLKSYISLYKQYLEITTTTEENEEIDEETKADTPNIEFMNKFNAIKSELAFLPFLDDIDECYNALTIQQITQYAPIHLSTPAEKPQLPVLGDEDVTEAIAAYITANDLQKEIKPSKEEIMNALVSTITMIDEKCRQQTNFDEMYGKYIIDGFPSDPEYWSILSESKLLPDYTIALIENREIEPELIEKYKLIDDCVKNHQERYLLAKDPLIEIKKKTKTKAKRKDSKSDVKMAYDIEKKRPQGVIDELELSPEMDPWTLFAEHVDRFKEEWDSVKVQLEEYNKCFLDVELENKSDVEIVEEVLLWLRKSYCLSCEVIEAEDDEIEDKDGTSKDMMTYNDRQSYGETYIYCPISYYDYGVLWEGKPEFSVKYNSKIYRLCKEEFIELLQKDITKYQSYHKPFKTLPPLRICVIGCIGSGKTSVSKVLSKELGLMHIDFAEILYDYLIPKHLKKVGRPYENSFTDTPIDDEMVLEFQMGEDDENIVSNISSNETELRKMVYNYFERGAQLHPQIMQKIIKSLWFQDPFLNTGFILDGYPRIPTDVEDMTTCFCIPDLVIEIESSLDHALNRLTPEMFNIWKKQLTAAKEKARQKMDDRRKEWMKMLTKNVVIKLICDEILDNMFFANEPIKGLSDESVIIDAHPSGSLVDAKLFTIYNEMIQELPEPVDESEWEKADEARERIDSRIGGVYESDDENIQALKDLLMDQRISTVSVDGKKSLEKVTKLALSKLTILRNRCESIFETTTIVNYDIAELLLSEGLCYLSRFNHMGPVYIYRNPDAIQNFYYVSKRTNSLHPVIHRSYIYFICGKKSVLKFRRNPLKYITCNNICEYHPYTLRIGVIGAAKSGRSTLSAKLAKHYGLLCLSRGIAVRNVLENRHWTELAKKIRSATMEGECVNWDHVMKSVQTLTMDHRTNTNGYVFDGFPETSAVAMGLAKNGIYPNILFDIKADVETIKKSSQKEIYYNILKRNPPYPSPFIVNRYIMSEKRGYKVRQWFESDYQNVYVLDGNKSKWQCLQDAVNIIDAFMPKVHYYLANVKTKIVPADVMCISNETFHERSSYFKNMCPLCLQKNILKHNAFPVDKKGVVQYRNKFYWVCSEHMSSVLKHPHCYLNMQKVDVPEHLPTVVSTINMSLVYENGVCIVTYAEKLPAQKIVVGTNKHAASFKGNTYLFCSLKCLQKFLAKPHMYYDITVFRQAKLFPPLALNSLPNIGYLEQAVANIITEACCSVNALRPKYPGLSFQLSGLLHIGLYLKTHNPRTDEVAEQVYMKAAKTFDVRCKLLNRVALFLRSMDNPFADYPTCCKRKDSDPIKPSSLSKSLSKHSMSWTVVNY